MMDSENSRKINFLRIKNILCSDVRFTHTHDLSQNSNEMYELLKKYHRRKYRELL